LGTGALFFEDDAVGLMPDDRRRPIHSAVSEHPTAGWTAHQLVEAFPWDSAPRYVLRDRDGMYGDRSREAATSLGTREALTPPQSPWRNAHVERLIGSIRRECLDHVIEFNEAGRRRILKSYIDYYDHTRTNLSLGSDSPVPRTIQPPELGRVVELSYLKWEDSNIASIRAARGPNGPRNPYHYYYVQPVTLVRKASAFR
jgi:putative transposase